LNLSAILSPAYQLLAQATQPASPAGAATQPTGRPAPDFLNSLVTYAPFILVIVVMYVFIFKSKKNQEKKLQQARDSLKRGDRVQTIGGILGNVVQVEDSKVLLKVDEGSNTKIWFSRNAIHRVLTEEKAEAAK
jgi:preprotein translocase subunit YajC